MCKPQEREESSRHPLLGAGVGLTEWCHRVHTVQGSGQRAAGGSGSIPSTLKCMQTHSDTPTPTRAVLTSLTLSPGTRVGGALYHPNLGGAAHFAVLGEHPAVVGQQHLQGVAHGDDQGHPEASAEQDAAHHLLGLARHVAPGHGTHTCAGVGTRLGRGDHTHGRSGGPRLSPTVRRWGWGP